MSNFWPKKQDILDIFISSLWVLMAWLFWSLFIFFAAFLLNNSLDINWVFWESKEVSSTFSLIISLVSFFWISLSSYMTYVLLSITDPDKYKKNIVILWQLIFFQIFSFVFLTPIYIYVWIISSKYIMLIFSIHIIFVVFGVNIIMDLMNNYRYVLISIYGNFLGLFVSLFFTIFILNLFPSGSANLIFLLLLLPIINFLSVFMKKFFEFVYYKYYILTSLDQIWDIFFQIELEEKEKLKEDAEKNSI